MFLYMIMFIKERIINCIKGRSKTNIKNRTYYFYNYMINIKNFEPNLLKIDRKSYKNIGTYNTGYIKVKKNDDCENIYSVNPLYLVSNHANGYIDIWNGNQNKIEGVSSGECGYEKSYMEIKFNSNDDLPLKKPLKFHNMTITIRSVFEEFGELYPQVFLDDNLYELSI